MWRRIQQHSRRSIRASTPYYRTFSSSTSTSGPGNDAGGSGESKHKPGWFSRNPGVTLGGVLVAIGLFIYRGQKNKKNFGALQNPLIDSSPLAPYEAWELRSSNEITPEVFGDVRKGVKEAFPSGKASMKDFDMYLGWKLQQACPNGIQKAYHLERMLLSLFQTSAEDGKCDVDLLLAAFALTVKGAVSERLNCLYSVAAQGNDKDSLSREKLERLIDCLMKTYQVPSEKRVMPTEGEMYPFQQYHLASSSELVDAALKEQVEGKKMSEEEAKSSTVFTREQFEDMLRGKNVCVWGECFSKTNKRRI